MRALHLFRRRWWKPAVQECGPARAACLPSHVHHRRPGLLAISSPRSRAARSRERQFIMDQRSANRRTWRFQLAMLFLFPHRDTLGRVRCEATHSAEAASSRVFPHGDTSETIRCEATHKRSFRVTLRPVNCSAVRLKSLISGRRRGGGFRRVSGLQCCWRSKDAPSCHRSRSTSETASLGSWRPAYPHHAETPTRHRKISRRRPKPPLEGGAAS